MKIAFSIQRVLCLLLFSFSTMAVAGQNCEETDLDAKSLMKGLELAHKTKQALQASHAQVALIARVGQDLSQYNLRYSHLGIVWRDHPNGEWLVIHELNQCGSANSALYNEASAIFSWIRRSPMNPC